MFCPPITWWKKWKEKRKLQHRQAALQNFKAIINDLDGQIQQLNELLTKNMNAVVFHSKNNQGSGMIHAMKVVNLVREIESLQSESLYAERRCQTIQRKNRMDAMQRADKFAGKTVAESSKTDEEYKKERENLSLVNTQYKAMIDIMKGQLNDKDDRAIAGNLLTTVKKSKINTFGGVGGSGDEDVNSVLAGISFEIAATPTPTPTPTLTPTPSLPLLQSQTPSHSISSSPLSLEYSPSASPLSLSSSNSYPSQLTTLTTNMRVLPHHEQEKINSWQQKQLLLPSSQSSDMGKALVPFENHNHVEYKKHREDGQLVKFASIQTNKHVPQRPQRPQRLQRAISKTGTSASASKSGYQKLLTAPGTELEIEEID